MSDAAGEVSTNRELAQALRDLLKYLDDHDWGNIIEGETADRARDLLAKLDTGTAPEIGVQDK